MTSSYLIKGCFYSHTSLRCYFWFSNLENNESDSWPDHMARLVRVDLHVTARVVPKGVLINKVIRGAGGYFDFSQKNVVAPHFFPKVCRGPSNFP